MKKNHSPSWIMDHEDKSFFMEHNKIFSLDINQDDRTRYVQLTCVWIYYAPFIICINIFLMRRIASGVTRCVFRQWTGLNIYFGRIWIRYPRLKWCTIQRLLPPGVTVSLCITEKEMNLRSFCIILFKKIHGHFHCHCFAENVFRVFLRSFVEAFIRFLFCFNQ